MKGSEATRAAAGWTANGPQKYAHTAKRRDFLANTLRPVLQPLNGLDLFVSLGDAATRVLSRLEEARR